VIQFASKVAGAAAVTVGLLALAFGSLWAPRALEFVSGSSISPVFETLLPFLPILLIASGAFLLVRSRH
jgi:hypothetical protein